MTQEQKQITDFVEKYNEQMDWNKDIRTNIKNNSKWSKDFIEHWLPTDKIDESSFELENAKVYPCDIYPCGKRLEMHIHSYKKCGGFYFWVNPNITEQEYKEQKIKFMREDIDYLLGELQPKIKDLVAKNNAYSKIKEILVKL